jgi:hypothetical protein
MSMTADAGDSLLLLFFLGLGILMALSLFAAILRGLRVILSYVMLKLNYGDEFREIINDDSAERYRNMSPERQEVIDNLRKHALLRYLSRFTLVSADEIADILTTQLFRSWIVYVCIAHNSRFSQHLYTDTGRRRLALLRGVTD